MSTIPILIRTDPDNALTTEQIDNETSLMRAPERFEILQAVRAIAALAVLLFHAGHAANKYGGPMPLIELTDMGIVGVDLFFVLSGFIILHVTFGRDLSCGRFARARFYRIFLPYWPVGLAMAVIIAYYLQQGLGARNWFASITLFPTGRPALNVAWTLQHEIVFYAIVALGLFSGWWRMGLALWGGAILFCIITDVAPPIGLQPVDAEFLMGIAAWAAWHSDRRPVMLATSLALVLLAFVGMTGGAALEIDRAGPIATAALFAACLPWLVMAEQNAKIHTPRILSFLGEASYSIYLVHALPLLLLVQFAAGFGWLAILPIVALAGLGAGIAYHLLVERPLLALMPR